MKHKKRYQDTYGFCMIYPIIIRLLLRSLGMFENSIHWMYRDTNHIMKHVSRYVSYHGNTISLHFYAKMNWHITQGHKYYFFTLPKHIIFTLKYMEKNINMKLVRECLCILCIKHHDRFCESPLPYQSSLKAFLQLSIKYNRFIFLHWWSQQAINKQCACHFYCVPLVKIDICSAKQHYVWVN